MKISLTHFSRKGFLERFFFSCILLFLSTFLFAQEIPSEEVATDTLQPLTQVDSLKKDSIGFFQKLKRIKLWEKRYPSPKNATLLSVVLPGSGQIYNKKYWKVPLVYASIGALGYFVYTNGKEYRRFKKAYMYRVDDDPLTEDEFVDRLDNASTIKTWRDYYDKNRQLAWIGLVFVWLLNSVDAYVDAHLYNFDVSDDLSLRIQPTFNTLPGQPTNFGIGLFFSPNHRKKINFPTNGF